MSYSEYICLILKLCEIKINKEVLHKLILYEWLASFKKILFTSLTLFQDCVKETCALINNHCMFFLYCLMVWYMRLFGLNHRCWVVRVTFVTSYCFPWGSFESSWTLGSFRAPIERRLIVNEFITNGYETLLKVHVIYRTISSTNT